MKFGQSHGRLLNVADRDPRTRYGPIAGCHRRHIRVLLEEAGEVVDRDAVPSAIEQHLSVFARHDTAADVAVALLWSGAASYRRLRAVADCVMAGLRRRMAYGRPVYLMIDGDIALTFDIIQRDEREVANDLLILDGIDPRDFDSSTSAGSALCRPRCR